MNIKPELDITLEFYNIKDGMNFKIINYLNKYGLRVEGYRSYMIDGVYLFKYILMGEPSGLIGFLQDKDIISKLI